MSWNLWVIVCQEGRARRLPVFLTATFKLFQKMLDQYLPYIVG
jgi:hypothetical protein